MILFVAAGYAAQRWLEWSPGTLVGAFAGLLTARLVPNKASCAPPRTQP